MSRGARTTTFVFRVKELANAIAWQAQQRRMTMRQVARENGVDPATLTRLKQGRTSLDADSLVTLLMWVGHRTPFMMPRRRAPSTGDGRK